MSDYAKVLDPEVNPQNGNINPTELEILEEHYDGIEQMMLDVPSNRKYASMNPGEGWSPSHTAPDTNQLKAHRENTDEGIDVNKLVALAKDEGVADNEEFKKALNSVKEYDNQFLMKDRSKACQDCGKSANTPCCQADCQIFKRMVERTEENRYEDRNTTYSSQVADLYNVSKQESFMSPCESCNMFPIHCSGWGDEEYVSYKMYGNLVARLDELWDLPKAKKELAIKEFSNKPKTKIKRKEHIRVKDIEIPANEFPSPDVRFELARHGIDTVRYTDYEMLKETLSEYVFGKVEYRMLDIEIPKVKKRRLKLETTREDWERIVKENKQEKEMKINDEVWNMEVRAKEMSNTANLEVIDDYLARCDEQIIAVFANTKKEKERLSSTSQFAIYELFNKGKDYIETDAKLGDYKIFEHPGNYNKLLTTLFVSEGNYNEDINYKRIRKVIHRLAKEVSESKVNQIAIPRFAWGSWNKLENILVVAQKSYSNISFVVYDPYQ